MYDFSKKSVWKWQQEWFFVCLNRKKPGNSKPLHLWRLECRESGALTVSWWRKCSRQNQGNPLGWASQGMWIWRQIGISIWVLRVSRRFLSTWGLFLMSWLAPRKRFLYQTKCLGVKGCGLCFIPDRPLDSGLIRRFISLSPSFCGRILDRSSECATCSSRKLPLRSDCYRVGRCIDLGIERPQALKFYPLSPIYWDRSRTSHNPWEGRQDDVCGCSQRPYSRNSLSFLTWWYKIVHPPWRHFSDEDLVPNNQHKDNVG